MKKEFNIRKTKCIHAIYYEISDKKSRGSVILWINKETPRELFISNLFVLEEFRRSGIGQKLLDYSLEAAKKLGLREISLKVLSGSWMEEWYKRNGFIEDHKHEKDKLITYLHKNI